LKERASKREAELRRQKEEKDPRPPKILISISTTNLTYIFHNARRHTRTYACTHYVAW